MPYGRIRLEYTLDIQLAHTWYNLLRLQPASALRRSCCTCAVFDKAEAKPQCQGPRLGPILLRGVATLGPGYTQRGSSCAAPRIP